MERTIGAALLYLALVAPVSAASVAVPPRPERYATDRAGVIEPARLGALNERLAQFERETSNQILVYVDRRVPAGTTLEEFANAAFGTWGVGQKGKSNGVVLFVFLDDRKFRFEVGYGLEGAIPDARTVQIREAYLVPQFRAGNYAGGIEQTADQLMKAARGEPFRGTGQTAAEAGRTDPLASWIWLLPLVGLAAGGFAARTGKSIGDGIVRGGVTAALVSAGLAMLGTLVSMDKRFMAVAIGYFLVGVSVVLAVVIGQGTSLTGRRRMGLGLMQAGAAMATGGFSMFCFSVASERVGRLGLVAFLGSAVVLALGVLLESEDLLRSLTICAGRLAGGAVFVGGICLVVASLIGSELPRAAYVAVAAAGVTWIAAWALARSRGWRLAPSGGSSTGFSSDGSSSSWSSSGDSGSSFSGGGGDSGGGGSSGSW